MGGKTSESAAPPSTAPVSDVVVVLSPVGNENEQESTVNERIKHPLENVWSIWFYSNVSQKWEENQVEVVSFDTVEDFWCLYHHMKLPSELMNGQDYSVFKKGIRPMWEDQANKRGARLLITLDKKNHQEMDSIWLDTVLMMIGENFDDLNHKIRGAVVNVRPKGNKIGIWLANKNDEADNIRLIKKLKQVLGISKRLTFYGHNSNMALYNA